MRRSEKDEHKEKASELRRDHIACHISDILEKFGVDAVPADCSEGFVRIVIVHHEAPDDDARDPVEEGDGWEETLIYEGSQIPYAVSEIDTLDPEQDDLATALAFARTAQDVMVWR